MMNAIQTLAVLAIAIPAMILAGAFLKTLLPRRPIRGMAVLVPPLVFLMLTRHTGLLENIGINSDQVLGGVVACCMGLVFVDRFSDWYG